MPPTPALGFPCSPSLHLDLFLYPFFLFPLSYSFFYFAVPSVTLSLYPIPLSSPRPSLCLLPHHPHALHCVFSSIIPTPFNVSPSHPHALHCVPFPLPTPFTVSSPSSPRPSLCRLPHPHALHCVPSPFPTPFNVTPPPFLSPSISLFPLPLQVSIMVKVCWELPHCPACVQYVCHVRPGSSPGPLQWNLSFFIILIEQVKKKKTEDISHTHERP